MPLVSVIVPCYNEQDTIRPLLEAICRQTHPRQQIEVIIADGLSTDRTREVIAGFQRDCPDLSVILVDNPKRIIPAGLNRALETARGDIIVRLDAHSVPCSDYVTSCVKALEAGYGENVGGVWEIRPGGAGWLARSIAAAAAHPLGVGDARYRLGGEAQVVDTVPFGAFRRSLVGRVGFFDETLLTNEDYEFNVRVRQAGGKIWFDPAIRSEYYARSDLVSLARQYWRYGYWKARMLRRYPGTFRWRQLAGIFVLSFFLLGVLAFWFAWARWWFFIQSAVYLLALLIAGVQIAARKKDPALVAGVPLAIACMHFAWGLGFIWSMIRF
jgi:glycosyltransferase involved in cell wall biosynthesis